LARAALEKGADDAASFVGNDVVEDFDAVPATFDDPFVLEQGQVLGDGCLGEFKTFPDLLHITALADQTGDDLEPNRVAKDFENFRLAVITLHFVEFNFIHNFYKSPSASVA
jgi:hypothetical protein